MKINTFFYSIKQGLKNIFRNKMFSLASIATMAACIFMFGLFYIIIANFTSTVHTIEKGVSVTVFFDKGLSEDEIQNIGDEISKRVEVGKIEYVSADEAWKDFQGVYFKGRESLAQGFAGDNPLANSAHYQIYLNDVSMQNSLVTYLQSIDGVRDVKESAKVANTLTDFNKLLGYVSGGIIIILLCVAVFLISNTVTRYNYVMSFANGSRGTSQSPPGHNNNLPVQIICEYFVPAYHSFTQSMQIDRYFLIKSSLQPFFCCM